MRGDQNICAVARIVIHDGQERAFRALAEEMSVATAKKLGTLTYQWYLAEDGKTCHVLERNADSNAVRVQQDIFRTFGDRVMAIADIKAPDFYGSPDPDIREAATPLGTRFYRPYAGFVR